MEGAELMAQAKSMWQAAEEAEQQQIKELGDKIVTKSLLFHIADGALPRTNTPVPGAPRKQVLMGTDPRLPAMPEKPTLMDFFKYRFGPSMHLLQSARHAVKAGLPEKMVLACLLHDIAVTGFIRSDHGYWGAQLVEQVAAGTLDAAVGLFPSTKVLPDGLTGRTLVED